MRPSKAAHQLVLPFLTLLGKKIREQSFTELEIEDVLGWDKGHIQRLRVGFKGLHFDEVLSILGVIGVEPRAFYAELYGLPPRVEGPRVELAELSVMADGLVNLLVRDDRITAGELARAVAARAGKDLLPEAGERQPAKESATEAPEVPEAGVEPIDAPAADASHGAVTRNDLPKS